MKNTISFHYNIYIDSLEKINDTYYFKKQNHNFIITKYIRSLDEAESLYMLNREMLMFGIKMHEIILTKDNSVVFYFEENYYVLMRLPNINNRAITYDDIINFNYVPSGDYFNKLDKSAWPFYWENKIDYIEYQFSSIQNKYPIINNSINYYIGIWENAISYYNDNVFNIRNMKTVCHKRVYYDMDILEYLNPLNLVIDYKERDISEYLKSFVVSENFTVIKLNKMLDQINMNRENAILLISRTLFPSPYFDLYERVVIDNVEEERIKEIIKKHEFNRILLKVMFKKYSTYNIPSISWIIK